MTRLGLLLLLLPALVGCSRDIRRTLPTCQTGGKLVGETWVAYVTCQDNLLVAAWSDISTGDFIGTQFHSSSTPGRVEYVATVKARGGRSAELKVVSTDGKTWTVTVNEREYRLEDGALFLVRTRGGGTKVTQIKQDLTGMQATDETWQRLINERSEVKDFVAQAGSKQ